MVAAAAAGGSQGRRKDAEASRGGQREVENADHASSGGQREVENAERYRCGCYYNSCSNPGSFCKGPAPNTSKHEKSHVSL